jgi:hypothetical protein
MSSPQKSAPQLNGLAVVPGSGNGKPTARSAPRAFDGTIASACESIGISLEQMFEMMRLAKGSDPRVVQFLHAWDALGASEQSKEVADAVCEHEGFAPVELLRVVVDAAFRFSMYVAQFKVALALPSVVERSIETAVTDDGIADRKMLFQHSGFLPTPKGSQTTIAIAQNAQANATSRSIIVAPSPEHTIRRLTHRFNEIRGLPRSPAARTTEALYVERPGEVEDNGK